MFQARFNSNVDRRQAKRREGGGAKGYRCKGSELASRRAEGEIGSCTAKAKNLAQREFFPQVRREKPEKTYLSSQAYRTHAHRRVDVEHALV